MTIPKEVRPVRALMLVLLFLLTPVAAPAKVLNVELKFTPYVGDPKAEHVETVPGTAAIFVNRVPYADQQVGKDSVAVTPAEHEIAPAVWIPVESLGPAVRKGRNTIRIVFTPADAQVKYHGRLSWVTVTDQERARDDAATNATAPGKEEKTGKGPMTFERELTADFAADLPWHHYPAVTAVGDDDKQKLTVLVMARAGAFKPDFQDVYALLAGDERLELGKIKEAKCLDAAYAAGVRLDAPAAGQLEFVTTGNPEVVIQRQGDNLFKPANASAFEKIKDEDIQMCAGIALSMAFPPRLVVVHAPDGTWRVVY